MDTLEGGLLVPDLKRLCREFRLPVSGRKTELVERIAEKLYDLYEDKDQEKFDAQALKINDQLAYTRLHRYRMIASAYTDARHIPLFGQRESIEKLLEASKRKAFAIPEELLRPYRITQVISDPVFFPAAPRDTVNGVELAFTYKPTDGKQGIFPALVVLKVYDADELPDGPDPSQVRCRMSKGRRAGIYENHLRVCYTLSSR